MVLITLILFTILGFFVLTIFDKKLRDQVIEKAGEISNGILRRSNVDPARVIINPLEEQIRKLTSGSQTGGIKLDLQATRSEL